MTTHGRVTLMNPLLILQWLVRLDFDSERPRVMMGKSSPWVFLIRTKTGIEHWWQGWFFQLKLIVLGYMVFFVFTIVQKYNVKH